MSPKTLLCWIATPCLHAALAGALVAQPRPRLLVELVAVPSTITYPFTFMRRDLGTPRAERIDTTGTMAAPSGSVIRAVRVVLIDSGGLRMRTDRLILQDSTGKRYTPSAFAPIQLENLLILDPNFRGFVLEGHGGLFTKGPEAGSSYMVVLKDYGHDISHSGAAGTSFLLVYLVPDTARYFTFSLPRYPRFH